MLKNLKKSSENYCKIEQCSFVTEREQEHKTAKKLSASGAQNFHPSAEREPCNFFSALKL